MTEHSLIPVSDIRRNVYNVLETIQTVVHRVGRDLDTVRLVAATKMIHVDRMLEAYQAGIRIFGENRLQEAQNKMEALAPQRDLAWHFIGRLQRRKIKTVVGRFELIHSVENVEQARAIDRCAREAGIDQAVLLEVNVGGEPSKGGFSVSDLMKVIPDLECMPNLSIQGLMTIPPLTNNPEQARPYFRELRQVADRFKSPSFSRIRMDELSMGMSHDFPIAIEEGATMVRIGTAIFGPRNVE